jgi:hypothetical protein
MPDADEVRVYTWARHSIDAPIADIAATGPLISYKAAQESRSDSDAQPGVVVEDYEVGVAVVVQDDDETPNRELDQQDPQTGDISALEGQLPAYMSLPPLPAASMAGSTDNERPRELPRSASSLSRPTSAQIATLIEGYHDDFLEMPTNDSEDALQDVLQSEVCRAARQQQYNISA